MRDLYYSLWDDREVNESVGDSFGEFMDFLGLLVAMAVIVAGVWI